MLWSVDIMFEWTHLHDICVDICMDRWSIGAVISILYPGNIWSTQGTKPFSCTRKHYHLLIIILCNHATICSLEKYTYMNDLYWIDNMDVYNFTYFYIYMMNFDNDKTRQAKKGRIVGEWYLQEFGYSRCSHGQNRLHNINNLQD